MRCHEWVEQISAGGDGELDSNDAAALDDHLAECPRCRAVAAEVEALRRRTLMATAVSDPALVERVLDAREAQLATGRTLRRRGAAVLGAVALLVVALQVAEVDSDPTGGGPAVAARVTVHLDGAGFTAPTVAVAPGEVVAWHNHSAADHHLVRDVGGTTVGAHLQPGQAETAVFSDPGTYRYFCAIHREMSGQVVVQS